MKINHAKKSILFISSLLVILTSCKKDNVSKAGSSSINGTWIWVYDVEMKYKDGKVVSSDSIGAYPESGVNSKSLAFSANLVTYSRIITINGKDSTITYQQPYTITDSILTLTQHNVYFKYYISGKSLILSYLHHPEDGEIQNHLRRN